ncbi:MAG: riboflavin synthase [Cyanobacteria bacterium]|nr:riboflavin synthase [Cyanobacteriota bacterium]
MFSGIVEEVGVISKVTESSEGTRLKIGATKILEDVVLGESISVSGVCLTVVEYNSTWFDVEATIETLRCTSLGELRMGDKVNLEKALKVSDRLGGHIVSGHVDTVAHILEIQEEGFSKVVKFGLDARWSHFFVNKGSVTVDGVSLTVVDVGTLPDTSRNGTEQFWFTVALIPHTMEVTTLGRCVPGGRVNIETDIIARYVVRLLGESFPAILNKERESLLFGRNDG